MTPYDRQALYAMLKLFETVTLLRTRNQTYISSDDELFRLLFRLLRKLECIS